MWIYFSLLFPVASLSTHNRVRPQHTNTHKQFILSRDVDNILRKTIVFNFDWWIHLRPGGGSTIRIKTNMRKIWIVKDPKNCMYLRIVAIADQAADIAYCFFRSFVRRCFFPVEYFSSHSTGNFFTRFFFHSHCVRGAARVFPMHWHNWQHVSNNALR